MLAVYEYEFKFIIIGDAGTGKSCLLSQYLGDSSRREIDPTVIEFGTSMVWIDGRPIKLHIWDTAGMEKHRAITTSYYRKTAGTILVYDITRKETFKNLERWLGEVRQHTLPNMTVTLLGNKCDLDDKRAVSIEEGQWFAKANGLTFWETSAKTGRNVQEAFKVTASRILRKIDEGVFDLPSESAGIRAGFGKAPRQRAGDAADFEGAIVEFSEGASARAEKPKGGCCG